MRIQVASDLHLELVHRKLPGEMLVQPAPDAEVLVLAGDIADGLDAAKLFDAWPARHKLIVLGNHEFYGHVLEDVRDGARAHRHDSVHVLDDAVVVVDGVRFIGSTLWTDFALDPRLGRRRAMRAAERLLSDYVRIETRAGRLEAEALLAIHRESRAWLEARLREAFDGPTVVVTHHGPHRSSVHPRYAGDPANPAFNSDLSELLALADLWIHGHVHDSFDYRIGRCRVVANPAGYVLGFARDGTLVLENRSFEPQKVVDVERR